MRAASLLSVLAGAWFLAASAQAYEVKNVHAPEMRFRIVRDLTGQLCTSNPPTGATDIDACECSLSTDYPQVHGMADPDKQDILNRRLWAVAAGQLCVGPMLSKTAPHVPQPQQANSEYRIHLNSPEFLSVMFEKSLYTGGAHPAYRAESLTVDMRTHKEITLSMLFPNNPATVNGYITRALVKRAREKDYSNSYAVNYLEPYHDRYIDGDACERCTFTLTPKGARLIFNPYAVAPFSDGFVEIDIPLEYVHSDIRKRLSN